MGVRVLSDQMLLKRLLSNEFALIDNEDLILCVNPTFKVTIGRHEWEGYQCNV